ncbi:hypothetical protein KRR39_06525 [Nocardioides panacis]|uniref:DUF1097 domain-containing protein n=1 Tax=Nocardioides panacis TaxID=2849501 RepID=A0A975T0N2_9ACTN|nr:hypothetical protein [Nocardioides panacis]QWZ09419.1 hypothetical protein KRR39_06525 [Nocardioides panacis]
MAAVLVVIVSSALDLELESVALLGGALGAVVALVPDRTPLVRLGGFAAGFVAAWIGYVVRAALLPDTAGGRAVAVGLVVLLCVGITAASMNRLPLWTTLLGTAALSGAYEFTFAAAPPELASTSVSTATTLLFNVAVGFLAAALVAPSPRPEGATGHRSSAPSDDSTKTSGTPRTPKKTSADSGDSKLDDFMMEKTK